MVGFSKASQAGGAASPTPRCGVCSAFRPAAGAALAGTEGSCGILLEATVRLVPRAAAPALAVLGYDDMAAAADDVPNLLPFRLEKLPGPQRDGLRTTFGISSGSAVATAAATSRRVLFLVMGPNGVGVPSAHPVMAPPR